MPFYNVVMGQGISTQNLGNDILMTGNGRPDDALQSCSAVILMNPATGAAGLYHFPAGNIDSDRGSQIVLTEMRNNIQPTQAYIVYGIVNLLTLMNYISGDRQPPRVPSDRYNMQLSNYIMSLLSHNSRLLQRPATNGKATVRINAGHFEVGITQPDDTPIDLRNETAGDKPYGRVYWRNTRQ